MVWNSHICKRYQIWYIYWMRKTFSSLLGMEVWINELLVEIQIFFFFFASLYFLVGSSIKSSTIYIKKKKKKRSGCANLPKSYRKINILPLLIIFTNVLHRIWHDTCTICYGRNISIVCITACPSLEEIISHITFEFGKSFSFKIHNYENERIPFQSGKVHIIEKKKKNHQ